MLDIQIATKSKNIPTKKQFQRWVDLVLKQQKVNGELTIRIVGKKESQQLNKQYRYKDKPTNVLSFPMDSLLGLPLLGDLVICAPLVREEAKQQHKKSVDHWAHLVIHGTLHLLGYDHEQSTDAAKMEKIEIKLLATLNIANPYEAP